jgi:hypothetical protein
LRWIGAGSACVAETASKGAPAAGVPVSIVVGVFFLLSTIPNTGEPLQVI